MLRIGCESPIPITKTAALITYSDYTVDFSGSGAYYGSNLQTSRPQNAVVEWKSGAQAIVVVPN